MPAMRDGETSQFGIEIDALLLSDKGVYCIDEFDTMDQADQTPIHYAMEQQTMTIAKTGIQAILNARSSIVAGSNSINGRCDKPRKLQHNFSVYESIIHDETSEIHVTQHYIVLYQRKETRNESRDAETGDGSGGDSSYRMKHTHLQDDIGAYKLMIHVTCNQKLLKLLLQQNRIIVT